MLCKKTFLKEQLHTNGVNIINLRFAKEQNQTYILSSVACLQAHAPDQTVYLLSCFLILACIPFRFLELTNVEDVLLIMAAPGSWFFLLFFARSVNT